MIKPTSLLSSLLEEYNCTMTVFWDILHFYTLQQHLNVNHELKKDVKLIKEQIEQLSAKDHDIQLHIHSHWLDAVYAGQGKWKFTYDKYDLHELDHTDNDYDEKTISGCIKLCSEILSKHTSMNRKYNSFRAGGYHVEPFQELIAGLRNSQITIDSSIIGSPKTNSKNTSKHIPYYKFSNSPFIPDSNGSFFEFPISIVEISLLKKVVFTLKKRKYDLQNKFGDGLSIYGSKTDPLILETIFHVKGNSYLQKVMNFVKNRNMILTTEGSFKEKIIYLIENTPDFSVMTLHPKNLNNHQLEVLSDLLNEKKVHFISIAEYINRYGLKA